MTEGHPDAWLVATLSRVAVMRVDGKSYGHGINLRF